MRDDFLLLRRRFGIPEQESENKENLHSRKHSHCRHSLPRQTKYVDRCRTQMVSLRRGLYQYTPMVRLQTYHIHLDDIAVDHVRAGKELHLPRICVHMMQQGVPLCIPMTPSSQHENKDADRLPAGHHPLAAGTASSPSIGGAAAIVSL